MRRRLRKFVRFTCGALLLLVALGAAYEGYARATSHRAFPPPGRMLDIGGYALHLNCAGAGQPTVLLESGLDPAGSLSWSRVQSSIADFTRVCSYDRAGVLWSDGGPQPRDGEQVVDELGRLLSAAGEDGPFVIAGHSHGGLYARIFASRHPEAVRGLVFVDATHPETMQRLPPDLRDPPNLSPLAQSVLIAVGRTGLFRVLGGGRTRQAYPDSVMPVLSRFGVQSMAAVFGEAQAIQATDSAAMETGPFGDIPILVLTPEVPVPPGMYELTPDQTTRLNAVLVKLQNELASLSANGRLERIPAVGHYIQLDDPDAVVRGIVGLLEDVRKGGQVATDAN